MAGSIEDGQWCDPHRGGRDVFQEGEGDASHRQQESSISWGGMENERGRGGGERARRGEGGKNSLSSCGSEIQVDNSRLFGACGDLLPAHGVSHCFGTILSQMPHQDMMRRSFGSVKYTTH